MTPMLQSRGDTGRRVACSAGRAGGCVAFSCCAGFERASFDAATQRRHGASTKVSARHEKGSAFGAQSHISSMAVAAAIKSWAIDAVLIFRPCNMRGAQRRKR